MNRPKVSVVIPVYNVAAWVERCVRSLMEQTLEEIEYIFVDDCSPDNSMDIVRKVVSDYPERVGGGNISSSRIQQRALASPLTRRIGSHRRIYRECRQRRLGGAGYICYVV